MPNQKLFLSYSRSELYFAESVVHALTRAGFDVWFDIQRLLPGMHWGNEIHSGLAECDALVLIASRSSLKSPNVAIEWGAMLKNQKPVYILLFENVRFEGEVLPPKDYEGELHVMSLEALHRDARGIIDCRGQFGKNVRRLINLIKSGEAQRDPIPAPLPDSTGISTRFSRGVTLVTLVLILNLAVMIEITINVFSISRSSFLAGLLLIGLLGVQLLHFLQRRFSYRQVRRTLLACAFLLTPFMMRYGNGAFTVPLWWILLLTYTFMAFSKDLLRWMPRGQAPASLRRGLRPFSRFRQRFSNTPTGQHFIVHHHPADLLIAKQVRRIMVRAGFKELAPSAADTNSIHFAIISGFTQMADFTELADSTERVVVILGSTIQDVDQYKPLLNRQLLDYRTQDVVLLRRTAEELRDDTRDAIVRELSVNLTPQGFTDQIIPSGIQAMTSILFLVGALALSAVAAFFWPVFGSRSDDFQSALPVIGIFLSPIALMGVWLAWLSNRLLRRDLRQRHFLWSAVLPFVLLGLLVRPILIVTAFWGLFAFVNVRHWMPTQSKPRTEEGRLRWKSDKLRWQRSLITYSVLLVLSFSFFGDARLFSTAAIQADAVTYSEVAITPSLMLQIPAQWFQAPLADAPQRAAFESNTHDIPPFVRLMDRGFGQSTSENTASSSLNTILSFTRLEHPVGRSGNLLWAVVYAPSRWEANYVFTVWNLRPDVDPFAILTDRASAANDPETVVMLDGITTADRQCLRVNLPNSITEMYCALDFETENYLLYFNGATTLFDEHQAIFITVIESARSVEPGSAAEATP